MILSHISPTCKKQLNERIDVQIVTAKSLNCWYRAVSKEDETTFCWEIWIYLTFVNVEEGERVNKRDGKRKSETQSHKKLCSEWNLQTKNFLSSPNVIQNIFVRDLNILDFAVFKAACLVPSTVFDAQVLNFDSFTVAVNVVVARMQM